MEEPTHSSPGSGLKLPTVLLFLLGGVIILFIGGVIYFFQLGESIDKLENRTSKLLKVKKKVSKKN